MKHNRFTVIDFETANNDRRSACSVGIVVVKNMIIIEAVEFLIKPPGKYFIYTDVHGLTWDDVKDAQPFNELWPGISKYFKDTDFVAAHNAAFDIGVLRACCDYYGITVPGFRIKCSLNLSRRKLNLQKNSLDAVCGHYAIELDHHNALSDSMGCAKIMIRLLGGYK